MNYNFRIAIRNLIRKPVYTLITFVGFTIAITAVLLIFIWITNELSYEKFHPDYNRIYRVLTLSKQGDEIVKSAGCYRPVSKTLKSDFPQIEFACYLSFNSEDSPLHSEGSNKKIEARGGWVDKDFFSIFRGFSFIEGSPEKSMNTPQGIILSEKVAQQLFGDGPALGKTVIMDKYSEDAYLVEGVVRIPNQSHIDFGFIFPESNRRIRNYVDHWGDKPHVHVYIKLQKNAEIDDRFLSQVSNHISHYTNKTDKLMFQPLADIHLHSDYKTYNYDKNISSYKYVLIFTTLAIIIILMASLNFALLTIARASERIIEIGIKKVNGANRFHIISQFIGESVFQTFAATLLALFIVYLCLPFFNMLSGQHLAINWSINFIIILFILAFLTSIVAGIFPSVYLSLLKPVHIIRGGNITGSKLAFMRILVAMQFGIAIFFMLTTFLFIKQMHYIKNKDLGLDNKNIVVVPTGLWYDNKAFKDELMRNPNIEGVSASAYAPVDFGWATTIAITKNDHIDSIQASLFWVDEDFAKTYKLEIIKGDFLKMDYKDYWKKWKKNTNENEEVNDPEFLFPVVINQAAEKRINCPDIIGQRFGKYIVLGVVKDFHFRPLHNKITPVILTNDPQNIMTMNIRIADNNRNETIQFIKETYKKHRDDRAFSYSLFDDLVAEKYSKESILQNLTIMFAILAIVLAILGILGMAYYTCERRIKEIGIRKVNGANTFEILKLINNDFIVWVVLAFITAGPIALYFMNKWLENFAYKTTISWWVFALAGCIALVIALLTVSWQTFRAARRNPIEALRYE
ncbi:MAG: ABC transporter permease [Salinivirgaceae bacterium]|nr:ABC transporter permease [Salinivirgaceae bacterium]